MNDPRVIMLAFLTTMFAAWAGLVLGVSFLSARAKFRAPSITLPVALDVRPPDVSRVVTDGDAACGHSLGCSCSGFRTR